jgi:hypothetical protein
MAIQKVSLLDQELKTKLLFLKCLHFHEWFSFAFAGVFMQESDVAAFTINAVDDPRTLNKVLYLRPPGNVCSLNELVEIWETKIGKKLERLHVSEEELLEKIKGIIIIVLSFSFQI